MHELGLAEGIFDLVRQHLPVEAAGRLREVHVRIGAMANVVAESLDFCFGAIVRGTPYGQAELVIEHVPAQAMCLSCGGTFELDVTRPGCPACGGFRTETIAGRELQVDYLELDDGPASADEAGGAVEQGASVS